MKSKISVNVFIEEPFGSNFTSQLQADGSYHRGTLVKDLTEVSYDKATNYLTVIGKNSEVNLKPSSIESLTVQLPLAFPVPEIPENLKDQLCEALAGIRDNLGTKLNVYVEFYDVTKDLIVFDTYLFKTAKFRLTI